MLCDRGDTGGIYIIWRCLFIDRIVQQVKEAGKVAMVHVDLVSGLSPKEVSVEYLKEHTEADGIISTKPSLIKKARELGMYTVLRYFLLDSMAFENIRQQQHTVRPDFIEVLPGVMPRVIKRICGSVKTPIIAGGLITDKEDVMAALSAGAIADFINQSSGVEDVMTVQNETEYLIAFWGAIQIERMRK